MNREIVQPCGAGIYPLTGDILSTAGNNTIRVIGLQGVPVKSGVNTSGSVLMYNQNTNQWEPILNTIALINGLAVSDDYDFTVNWNPVNSCTFSVNGTTVVVISEQSTGPLKVNGVSI